MVFCYETIILNTLAGQNKMYSYLIKFPIEIDEVSITSSNPGGIFLPIGSLTKAC